MEAVKSSLETQVENHIEEQDKIAQAKEFVRKRTKLIERYQTGKLTFAEYQTKLSRPEKAAYRRRFGTPKRADEIQAAKKNVAKRRRSSTIASRSRRANKSRSR